MTITTVIASPCLSIEELQEMQDCAVRQAVQDCPPGAEKFCNAEYTATSTCPDGSTFSYTIPAGTICAASQAEADAQAVSLAEQRAIENRFCSDGGSGRGLNRFQGCQDVVFSGAINLDPTLQPYTWFPASGALPAGIAAVSTDNGVTLAIAGTPTTPGRYTAGYLVTSSRGTTLYIEIIFNVVCFTPLVMPAGSENTPYSQLLTPAGGNPDSVYTFAVTSGTLPPGLTLDPLTGLISGTPTTAGTYNFEVAVQASL